MSRKELIDEILAGLGFFGFLGLMYFLAVCFVELPA